MGQWDALWRCFLSKSELTVNRKQLDMSSDVSFTLQSSKTTFKENISTCTSLGNGTTERFLRIHLATGQRKTDAASAARPRPTETWEEYDTDPAMNIIVVLLFPGRKEERQRRGREESHPL